MVSLVSWECIKERNFFFILLDFLGFVSDLFKLWEGEMLLDLFVKLNKCLIELIELLREMYLY